LDGSFFENHGSYAGLSVAIVNVPAVVVLRAFGVHPASPFEVGEDWAPEDPARVDTAPEGAALEGTALEGGAADAAPDVAAVDAEPDDAAPDGAAPEVRALDEATAADDATDEDPPAAEVAAGVDEPQAETERATAVNAAASTVGRLRYMLAPKLGRDRASREVNGSSSALILIGSSCRTGRRATPARPSDSVSAGPSPLLARRSPRRTQSCGARSAIGIRGRCGDVVHLVSAWFLGGVQPGGWDGFGGAVGGEVDGPFAFVDFGVVVGAE